MSKLRPHLNLLTNEIKKAVQKNKDNPIILKELLEEIEFRKKAAAKLQGTKAEALKYLNKLDPKRTKHTNSNAPDIRKGSVERVPQVVVSGSVNKTEISKTSRPKRSSDAYFIFQNRPSFFSRIVGVRSCDLLLFNHEIVIQQPRKTISLEHNRYSNVYARKKLMKSLLVIGDTKNNPTFVQFPKRSFSKLRTLSQLLVLLPEITQALEKFDMLLAYDGYISMQQTRGFIKSNQDILNILRAASDSCGQALKLSPLVQKLLDINKTIQTRNTDFVVREKKQWAPYFNQLETNPLTNAQVEAILRDDSFTLVVAGAGTGKTSTVVGKVGYLLKKEIVTGDEVLALAFARKAAAEMRERVADRTGENVSIKTFHSLGLQIILDAEQAKPSISDVAIYDGARNALIAKIAAQLLSDPQFCDLITNFIAYHRYPAKYLEDFSERGEYLEYLRKHEPVTLKGERVKSFEELLLADWLTLSGINYSYEHPYEIPTHSRQRRQYKPDFYLVDYGIYIEHFGIDKKGNTAPGIDKENYNKGIEWKRELHRVNQTKLVETFSWERMEGQLTERLKDKLIGHGVKFTGLSTDQIKELITQREINQKFVALLSDFLSVFKEGQWTIDEIVAETDQQIIKAARTDTFLKIFQELYDRYQQYLNERQELDFPDLIRKATEYVSSGKYRSKFKRIIVDEYQDISRGRQKLIASLLQQNEDIRMMCVGDDWQSIFGFTGSDIRMTTEFTKVFDEHQRVDLDTTFRFVPEILNVSNRFVQANPSQLTKRLRAHRQHIDKSVSLYIRAHKDQEALLNCLLHIEKRRTPKKRVSALILGRYNFNQPENLEELSSKFKMIDLTFMTVHKSKGLEADYVVILECNTGRFGFPGEIPNDPIMKLVRPGEEEFEHAEERRVFYVAITRAKLGVIVIADADKPSPFITELREFPEVHTLSRQAEISGHKCHACSRGTLNLVHPRRLNGYPWQCTLHPYCNGKGKMCGQCVDAPVVNGKCLNPSCNSNKN